jgi:hypothetical protein
MNVRDFGARKMYLRALLDEGIHVGVVRPGKQTMTVANQVSVVAKHLPAMLDRWVVATSPMLLVLRPAGLVARDLDDLLSEIDDRTLP